MNIAVENLTKEYGPQKAIDSISLVYAELDSAIFKILISLQLFEILNQVQDK